MTLAIATGWPLAAIAAADSLGLAVAGWLVAALAMALAVWQQMRLDIAGRLVAEASHELRGPLCAARLAVGSLVQLLADAPDAGARLAAIDLELRRAGLAVDDLGAALDAERSPADHELFDVNTLLQEAEAVWRPLARAHGAELRLEPASGSARVWGDRLRLAQAIGNLVANASEHGSGLVAVSVRADAESVRVAVSDDGPGLPAPIEDLIVARHGRGLRRLSSQPARGHGLAVAARVAGDLGGRLAAAPAARGARIVLELPAGARRSGGLASEPARRAGECLPLLRRAPQRALFR